MIRFLLVSIKRPKVNLEKYIGKYEFSVVASYGKLSLESNKADVMHGIEKEMKQANKSWTNEEQAILEATVIFDGMAIVKKIKLGHAVQNCRQLAKSLLTIALCEPVMLSKSVLYLTDIWSPY